MLKLRIKLFSIADTLQMKFVFALVFSFLAVARADAEVDHKPREIQIHGIDRTVHVGTKTKLTEQKIQQLETTIRGLLGTDDKIIAPLIQHIKEPTREKIHLLMLNAEADYILNGLRIISIIAGEKIAQSHKQSLLIRATDKIHQKHIDAGAPPKPIEVKNKTSKDVDLLLDTRIEAKELGAVVHYNPLSKRDIQAEEKKTLVPHNTERLKEINTRLLKEFNGGNPKARETLWLNKLNELQKDEEVLKKMKELKLDPALLKNHQFEQKLYFAFIQRRKEYLEEDDKYQENGMYGDRILLHPPYVRLRIRPDDNIYGDTDLFAIADSSGLNIISDETSVEPVIAELINSPEFQAQHPPIYYWNPHNDFDKNIKSVITKAHDENPGNDPLLDITPHGIWLVLAKERAVTHGNSVEFIVEPTVKSVWAPEACKNWLKKTPHGLKLIEEIKSLTHAHPPVPLPTQRARPQSALVRPSHLAPTTPPVGAQTAPDTVRDTCLRLPELYSPLPR